MVGSSVGIMFGAGGPKLARSHKSPRTVPWAAIAWALSTARGLVIQSMIGGSRGGGFGFGDAEGFVVGGAGGFGFAVTGGFAVGRGVGLAWVGFGLGVTGASVRLDGEGFGDVAGVDVAAVALGFGGAVGAGATGVPVGRVDGAAAVALGVVLLSDEEGHVGPFTVVGSVDSQAAHERPPTRTRLTPPAIAFGYRLGRRWLVIPCATS